MHVGDRFSESVEMEDQLTGRYTRRLTTSGVINNTPTYHVNTAFTRDSRYLVFGRTNEDESLLLKADVETGELTVVAVSDHTRGGPRFAGGSLALVQATNSVALALGKSLRLYSLDTLEERILIDDIGPAYRFGHPAGSYDGRTIYVPRVVAHPDLVRGMENPRDYFAAVVAEYGGMPTTHLAVDVATRQVTELFHEPANGCNHVQICPRDPDLLLIDRDAPPRFSHGGDDGRTSRCWLLRLSTGELIEVRPRDENRFQIHTNWSYDGAHVFYHGRGRQGGHYVGVGDHQGRIVWEHHFPGFFYGHMSSDTQRRAIITDGLFTPDLITEIHYEELDSIGVPRLEILAKHSTNWGGVAGQYSHPHPHMSPDGRWLSYNKGEEGRADVYLVRMK